MSDREYAVESLRARLRDALDRASVNLADVVTGSETRPGVVLEGFSGTLRAWDYHPFEPGKIVTEKSHMATIEVWSQHELDAALSDGLLPVCVGHHSFIVRDKTDIDARDFVVVTADDYSGVRCFDYSRIQAFGHAGIIARGSSTVVAHDQTHVTAHDDAVVRTFDRAHVNAYDEAVILACGHSTVNARDRVAVDAYDQATIVINNFAAPQQVRIRKFSDEVTVVEQDEEE